MNRWLYRAAGTVGVASGFLLLGAGSAQADEAGNDQWLPEGLGDVFSPTAGLPPLNLGLDGVPLREVPLDGAGLPGGVVGVLPPVDDLANLDLGPVGLPTGLPPAGLLPAGPATAGLPVAATPVGPPAGPSSAELIGPALLQPVTDQVVDARALANLAPIADLPDQVPVAGPMIGQTAGSLPVAADVVPRGDTLPVSRTLPVSHTLPVEQVPAVIGDQLAAESGLTPELLGPAIGQALNPVSKMVGVGNLADQLPLVGPVAGPAAGNLPIVTSPAPGGSAAPAAPAGPVGPASPAELPATVDGRPVAGEDPEFRTTGVTESAELVPAVPAVPVDAVGLASGLPGASPVPLGSLPVPLALLQSLPVVDTVGL